MLPVEIHTIQDAVILRARGSELLILSEHVTKLKDRKTAKEFADYFLAEALVNRPARKLFEAWLRKDGSLWARLYKTVQAVEQSAPESTKSPEAKAPEPVIATKVEVKAEKKEKAEPAKTKAEKAPAAPAKKTAAAAKPVKTAKKAETKAPAVAKKASKAAAPASKSPTKAAGRSSGK